MADIAAHPWMQGQLATEDEVKQEFLIRHQIIKEKKKAEAEANKIAKQNKSFKQGVHAGGKIGGKVYLDIDDGTEESKDPSHKML
jgi:hypothetical protein